MAHIEKFKAGALGAMTAHYARVPELRGYERENIDSARTHLNVNLRDCGKKPVEFVQDRVASLDLPRMPRKDAVLMVDTVVTMPEGYQGDPVELFGAVADTLDEVFGRENCISAWVHLDEKSPHMHYASVPIVEGRLSAKALLSRQFLKEFHGRLESGVCRRLGVERVGLTLTESEHQERAGRYVELPEFKAAKAAAEVEQQRLEGLQRACAEVEPAAQGVGESAGTLLQARGDGAREKGLAGELQSLRARDSRLGAALGKLKQAVRGVLAALGMRRSSPHWDYSAGGAQMLRPGVKLPAQALITKQQVNTRGRGL